jgi:hypothetical protein
MSFFRALAKRFSATKSDRQYQATLTAHQLWMVSLSAVFTARMTDGSHTTLYPLIVIDPDWAKEALKVTWDVDSKEGLLDILAWLAAEGHRISIQKLTTVNVLAWDLARYASTVRDGFAAGFLDEDTAWDFLRKGIVAADVYQSWEEYGRGFLTGRQIWMSSLDNDSVNQLETSQDEAWQAVQRLIDPTNDYSPWHIVPWQAIRYPDVRLG